MDCREARAIATAISPVLSRKYTVAAPTSGRATAVTGLGPAPDSAVNADPAPATVTTSVAMLNSVR